MINGQQVSSRRMSDLIAEIREWYPHARLQMVYDRTGQLVWVVIGEGLKMDTPPRDDPDQAWWDVYLKICEPLE